MAFIQFKVLDPRGFVSPDGVFYALGQNFFADPHSVEASLAAGFVTPTDGGQFSVIIVNGNPLPPLGLGPVGPPGPPGISTAFVVAAVQTAGFSAAPNTVYPCDTTSGGFVATLPTAVIAGIGKVIRFKKITSPNVVTITAAGLDTIDGAATLPLSVLNASLDVQSDGIDKWYVV